jgi:hypothetical protein
VLRHYEIHWPIWIYIAIWLGATGLAAGSLKVLEELGDRSL